MSAEQALVFDRAMLLDSAGIALESFSLGTGAPLQVKPLRKLSDGTVRSGLLCLAQGWTSGAPLRARTALQLLIRRGRIVVGDRTLQANAFVVVPAGGVVPVLAATEECELLMIQDDGQKVEALSEPATRDGEAVIIEDVFAIEPVVPVIAGRRLDGFERRVLWLDPVTGADTRLLRIPPGFSGSGPNWHPVNEEIFCLDGEIEPAAGRTMKPGWFLWNPVRSVHGYHETTQPGCVLLEWHDGQWDLVKYRQENPEA